MSLSLVLPESSIKEFVQHREVAAVHVVVQNVMVYVVVSQQPSC